MNPTISNERQGPKDAVPAEQRWTEEVGAQVRE